MDFSGATPFQDGGGPASPVSKERFNMAENPEEEGEVRPEVEGGISEEGSEKPVSGMDASGDDEPVPEMTEEAKAILPKVIEAIESIRPALQNDGGDIELVTITPELKARVKLVGACSGCPSAALTLRYGVERYLCESVPELNGLESALPIPGLDGFGEGMDDFI